MGFGGAVPVLAGLCLVTWTLLLCASDIRYRRLPNALTVPPALAALAGCVAWPSLIGGWVWPALYLGAGMRGFGGGDVKLAVSLGVLVAAAGGVGAVFLAVALSGLCTVALAAARGRKTVAHGPSMLLSAWVIVVGCAYSA